MSPHSPALRRRTVALLRRQDLTLDQVSDVTGVHRRTLYSWARAAGLPLRSRAKPSVFGARTRRRAVRLYAKGLPMREIGAATGASPTEIRKWAKAAGVPMRPLGSHARIDHARALDLARTLGCPKAAQILGCSAAAVQYHVRRERILEIRAKLRGES